MQKLIKKDIVENCQAKNDTWNQEMGVSEKKIKGFLTLFALLLQNREDEKDLRKNYLPKADGALKAE